MWPLRAQGALASSYHCPVFLTQCTRQGSQHAHLQGHWPSGPGGPCQPACLSCPASHPGSPRKGALLSPRAQNTVPSLQPKLASPSHTTAGTLASPTLFAGPQGSRPRAPGRARTAGLRRSGHPALPSPASTHAHPETRPPQPYTHAQTRSSAATPTPAHGPGAATASARPPLAGPEKPFHAPVTSHSEGQNSLLAADG